MRTFSEFRWTADFSCLHSRLTRSSAWPSACGSACVRQAASQCCVERWTQIRIMKKADDSRPLGQLERIYAEPFATNRASVRVLEKAGFTCEGRLNAVFGLRGHDT